MTALHLESPRLQIEIAPPQLVAGARWNRGAFVTQVTLDNRHTFCGREPTGGSEGIGLCGEFGLFVPVGYDEARAGEWFPKLGVGLLHKTDGKPYDFTRPYLIESFEWQIESAPDALQFECPPLPCRGYAARLRHTLSVRENALVLDTELENVGERVLRTREYRHNFLSLDGEGPGPKLALETSFALVPLDAEPTPARPLRFDAVPRPTVDADVRGRAAGRMVASAPPKRRPRPRNARRALGGVSPVGRGQCAFARSVCRRYGRARPNSELAAQLPLRP